MLGREIKIRHPMPSFVRISNKVDTLGHACGIAIHEPESLYNLV